MSQPVSIGGASLLRQFGAFRAWGGPRIIAEIASASDDDLRRPGTITGGVEDGSVFAALVHIIDVEESWLDRLVGQPDRGLPTAERYPTVEAAGEIWTGVSARWTAYLAEMTDESITHPVMLGSVEVPAWTVVMHTFNHTTHHRAEIWSALTSFGQHPPQLEFLDFIDPRKARHAPDG